MKKPKHPNIIKQEKEFNNKIKELLVQDFEAVKKAVLVHEDYLKLLEKKEQVQQLLSNVSDGLKHGTLDHLTVLDKYINSLNSLNDMFIHEVEDCDGLEEE